jgi:hypothetical protein
MPTSTSAPLLSIVVTARHVATGDFSTEVLRPLRFNHEQLLAHGIAHEFVLVAGTTGLSADPADTGFGLNGALSVLSVDPRYDDAFPGNREDGMELVARNAGIRRSRGTFILSTESCVCLGRRVLRKIADRALERGIVYRAPRVDIGVKPAAAALGWDSLEQPRSVIGRTRSLQPPMYLGDTADFILLDRETFHQLRGFDEIHGSGGSGADAFVVKALANGYPVQGLGAPVYHIHDGPSLHENGNERNVVDSDVTRRAWRAARAFRNPDTWGLSAAPERLLEPYHVSLEFDWSAVPVLVDLGRVVPAAAGADVAPVWL